MAFHLEDSASFRAFARLPLAWTPKKSVLHKTISAITAPRPGRRSIGRWCATPGRTSSKTAAMVRIDSTVTAALMHEPSDSTLLWDAVRVMARLLEQAGGLPGAPAIALARSSPAGQKAGAGHRVQPRQRRGRRQLYRELIAVTRATMSWPCSERSCGWPHAPASTAEHLARPRSAIICR